MEITTPIIHLATPAITLILGALITHIIKNGKISLLQTNLERMAREIETNRANAEEKYKNLETILQTQEASLRSVISTEEGKNASLQNLNKELSNRIQQIESLHKEATEEIKKSYEEKMENLRVINEEKLESLRKEELTVRAYAYEEHYGDDGFIVDDRRAEIGYKLQLFVKGIPCLDAYKIPLQILLKKEVNMEKIKEIREQAINTIQDIAKMHPAFKVINPESKTIKSINK